MLVPLNGPESLIVAATATCESVSTRINYAAALRLFMAWCNGSRPLDRQSVAEYLASMADRSISGSRARLALSAIKKLTYEAEITGAIDHIAAMGIRELKGPKRSGQRAGRWLTIEQERQLLSAPNRNTPIGKRDRAMLAVLLGCGLRRTEVCDLETRHVDMRDSRPCLVDIMGKGGKTRTVPMPWPCYERITTWKDAANITDGVIFFATQRTRKTGFGDATVWQRVTRHAARIGLQVAPHDLRRTAARRWYREKGNIREVQQLLGHSSPETTIRYLGTDLPPLEHSAVDEAAEIWEEFVSAP